MRQNFDFVTMDDYAADMRESANHAAGIIAALRRQIKDRERFLALVVKAAGGTVKVYERDLADLSPVGLMISRDPTDDSLTLKFKE